MKLQEQKGLPIQRAREKPGNQQTRFSTLQCMVVVLLILMSSLKATAADNQKRHPFDLIGKHSSLDETDLMEKSKVYEFKEHLPNIIQGPDHSKQSKGNASVMFAYIILGLFACLFVFYIIYTILDFWVLSRRGWKQRVGELEHD